LPFEIEEAVNQLRVNLGFCGDQIKTVMITSSVPNEGKSFLTMQLWRMMAEVGSRVLLIDCDLRKSEMRAKYGISSNEKITGIAHYLAGKVELPDAIYSTNVPNGFLMPLRSEEHTSELQSRFDLVCRLLLEKKKYDFSLVDKAVFNFLNCIHQ